MSGYLSERALEIAAEEGIETAMVWLAVHARERGRRTSPDSPFDHVLSTWLALRVF